MKSRLLNAMAALYIAVAASQAQTAVVPATGPSTAAPTPRVSTVEDVVRDAIQKSSPKLTNIVYESSTEGTHVFNVTDASKVKLKVGYTPSTGLLTSGSYSMPLTNAVPGIFSDLLTVAKIEQFTLAPAAKSVGMKTFPLQGTNGVYFIGLGQSPDSISRTFAVVPAENKVGVFDNQSGFVVNSYTALDGTGNRDVNSTSLAIRALMQPKRNYQR